MGALLLLALQLLGDLRVAVLRRCGERPDAALRERVRRLARRAGLERAPAVLLLDDLAMPATAGVLRPAVLMPRRVLERLDGARLDAVLLHELIHVARRDVAVHELARLVRALAWPVPFAWLAVRRLAVDREIATDAAVVARLGDRLPYAEGLLRVLDGREPRAVLAPTATRIRGRW